jgi:hypothetical protein
VRARKGVGVGHRGDGADSRRAVDVGNGNSLASPEIQSNTADLARSNSLVDLAARIKAEHEATAAALKDSVAHAMAAGDLLIEAKAQLAHGQWLPWLTEHCAISERTAQLYMRTAKHRTTIEARIRNGVADLSLNEATAMLVLTSDVKELFAFTKRLESVDDPEQVIALCIKHGIGVIYDESYNPFAHCDEAGIRDWHLFVLFFAARVGWRHEGACQHIEWILQRQFKTPCEYLGEEGTKFRAQWGMPEPGDRFKDGWRAYLAEHEGWTLSQIEDAMREIIKRDEATPAVKGRHRGRSRRAAP